MDRKEVLGLLQDAKSVDKGLNVFGASKHKYQLNPVIAIDKVREFEEKYGLKLPDEYVFFLTEIGNGGAGPHYGLYSLEKVEVYNSEWLNQDVTLQPFINENMTPEMWKFAMDECEDDDKYDEIMQEIYTGILVIGTQGCTYDSILMCKGSERGKIVYIDWNLEAEYPPYLTGMKFDDWYKCFFKEVADGNNVHAYGYDCLGTEENLIEKYQCSDSFVQKKIILGSFRRFKKISQNTIEFLLNLKEKDIDAIRLNVLLQSSLTDGLQLFEKFLSGENIVASVECGRMLPEKMKDRFYQPMLRLLYQENEVDKVRLLYYLNDCKSCCARDIAEYAMNSMNPENTRKAAIYVMGQCLDANEYIDEFIFFMKDESYWIAHTALQATIRAKLHSQQLMECYMWMKAKYKNDSVMQSNLKSVIKE